jgi:hypothetical protein
VLLFLCFCLPTHTRARTLEFCPLLCYHVMSTFLCLMSVDEELLCKLSFLNKNCLYISPRVCIAISLGIGAHLQDHVVDGDFESEGWGFIGNRPCTSQQYFTLLGGCRRCEKSLTWVTQETVNHSGSHPRTAVSLSHMVH